MKKIKAFTLLETLIVIMVFCIWILVVLNGLSQTLRNKDYANTQIKSAFFAREWIELVFNLRDANYHKELPWNCIYNYSTDGITITLDENGNETNNTACDWNLEPWTILKISMWSNNEYIHVETSDDMQAFTWMFKDYQIYVHTWWLYGMTWFYYDYTWEDYEKTWFARYLVVTWVDNWWHIIDPKKLLKIESHVLYQRWSLTWERVMETFIWNYEFKE